MKETSQDSIDFKGWEEWCESWRDWTQPGQRKGKASANGSEKDLAPVILQGAADENSRRVGLRIIGIWRLSHDSGDFERMPTGA